MPTNYSGNPFNVTTPLTRTITNATNNGFGTIVITTSAAHLFSTYDQVLITGVVGAVEANGVWTIDVLSSTTFALEDSTFGGAYVSGGTAADASLTPFFQLPSNGIPLTAQSVNAPLQALADRTQYLATVGSTAWAGSFFFNTSGDHTIVVPAFATKLIAEASGGGGGGLSGAGGVFEDGTGPWTSGGGGGGGGAIAETVIVTVTPGETLTVHVADGGIGADPGSAAGGIDTPTAGNQGQDGGTTTITNSGGSILAAFRGGGRAGQNGNVATATTEGAGPTQSQGGGPVAVLGGPSYLGRLHPGDGGPGRTNGAPAVIAGVGTTVGFGIAGATGVVGSGGEADLVGYGGGGGGAGCNPFVTASNKGGNGGNGGTSFNGGGGGTDRQGGPGAAGSAGTGFGSGGGGGGGGGGGVTVIADGGAGGKGAIGYARGVFIK